MALPGSGPDGLLVHESLDCDGLAWGYRAVADIAAQPALGPDPSRFRGPSMAMPMKLDPLNEYKRKFRLRELYAAALLLPSAIAALASNRRRELMDKHAVERVMLAVTEVNGCPACSWAHTRMALREGMSGEEISSLLSGDGEVVPPDEATGVVFAQHNADSRGHPDRAAYDAVVREYGLERARTVLAAAQVMLVGNMYGIPYSAFHARLRGAPYADSTIAYEVGMQVAGALVLPVALVHGLVRQAAGGPVARFATD